MRSSRLDPDLATRSNRGQGRLGRERRDPRDL